MFKVVDIFAGPGGLSEGFSSVIDSFGKRAFDVVLSIEMDQYAVETLRLRTYFRQFLELHLATTISSYAGKSLLICCMKPILRKPN